MADRRGKKRGRQSSNGNDDEDAAAAADNRNDGLDTSHSSKKQSGTRSGGDEDTAATQIVPPGAAELAANLAVADNEDAPAAAGAGEGGTFAELAAAEVERRRQAEEIREDATARALKEMEKRETDRRKERKPKDDQTIGHFIKITGGRLILQSPEKMNEGMRQLLENFIGLVNSGTKINIATFLAIVNAISVAKNLRIVGSLLEDITTILGSPINNILLQQDLISLFVQSARLKPFESRILIHLSGVIADISKKLGTSVQEIDKRSVFNRGSSGAGTAGAAGGGGMIGIGNTNIKIEKGISITSVINQVFQIINGLFERGVRTIANKEENISILLMANALHSICTDVIKNHNEFIENLILTREEGEDEVDITLMDSIKCFYDLSELGNGESKNMFKILPMMVDRITRRQRGTIGDRIPNMIIPTEGNYALTPLIKPTRANTLVTTIIPEEFGNDNCRAFYHTANALSIDALFEEVETLTPRENPTDYICSQDLTTNECNQIAALLGVEHTYVEGGDDAAGPGASQEAQFGFGRKKNKKRTHKQKRKNKRKRATTSKKRTNRKTTQKKKPTKRNKKRRKTMKH